MSPESPTAAMTNPSVEQVMFDVAVAFGRCIANEDCTVDAEDAELFAVFKQIFGETVGNALKTKPHIWDRRGRTYVFKQVRKIAYCASSVAKDTNRGVISAAIFEDCARERIAIERVNCSYAAQMAENNPGWRDVPWGDFCGIG